MALDEILDYSDDWTVRVCIVHDGYQVAEADHVWQLPLGPVEIGRAEPTAAVLSALDSASPSDFLLDEEHHYTEWGASGATHSLILTLGEMAAEGVVGELVWEALRRLGRRASDAAAAPGPNRPLERDEAIERARWHVAAAFKSAEQEPDALQLVGETMYEDGSWVVELQEDEVNYEVRLEEREGLVGPSRISRRLRETR